MHIKVYEELVSNKAYSSSDVMFLIHQVALKAVACKYGSDRKYGRSYLRGGSFANVISKMCKLNSLKINISKFS